MIGGFLFIPLHSETWFVPHLVSNSNFSFYLFLFVKLYQVWGGILCSASFLFGKVFLEKQNSKIKHATIKSFLRFSIARTQKSLRKIAKFLYMVLVANQKYRSLFKFFWNSHVSFITRFGNI